MSDFEKDDRVEYPAHPVAWVASDNETEHDWQSADGREPVAVTLTAEEIEEAPPVAEIADVEPQPEVWLPATVLSVDEVAVAPHLNRFEPDVVLKLEPDDGSPPFELNAKLVRPLDE